MKRRFLLWMACALLSGIFSMARADNLTLSALSLTPGRQSELVFNLENSTSYYGFQADITLPDGVTPVMNSNGKPTVALGSRFGTSYMAYSSVIGTGEVRVGTFSANHTPISGNSGELFRVPVNVSSDFKRGSVKVEGIKFIDASNKDVNFPGIVLSTTVDIPTNQDKLYIENFDIMQGDTKSVAVMLDNDMTYTAFQADITLSSNLTLVPGSIVLSNRASGLTLSEKISEGMIRLAAFSADKSPISGNSGTLLTFSVKASDNLGKGSISLSNILFTSTEIQEYRFGNTETEVTIVEPYATDILLSKENIVMLVGDAADITATVLPENAKDKTVVWTSQDATVAKYENGKIVALSAGTTTVTAICGEATATCTVTVKNGSDITATPGSGTGDGEDDGNGWVTGNDVYVHVNRTVNMNLSMPEGLTETPTLIWKLTDGGEKFVKLTPANNTLSAAFTGLSVGETVYTVSLNGKELLTGKVIVIAEITMNSLHLEPASLSMAQNALPVKLETKYTPTNATMPKFSWTSSNPEVATIGDDGTVTPKTQGRTMITATVLDGSDLSATAEITVTAPIAESFEFEEAAMGGVEGISIFIGDTYTLQPKAKEGYVLPDNIVWISDYENIASVDQNGKVTGLAMGEANITASALVNGKEVKATCKVTVKPIPLTSVLVTAQSTTTLKDGETAQLTAKTEPADATQPIEVVWSSDKPEVASVDEKTGLVTAHSVIGKATITAVVSNPADNDVKGTIEVTVIATDASRIILNTYDLTMLVGQENHLTGTVEPATTTNPTINWSIDNPLIASIDSEGNISAISPGTATVTATCGEAKATCTLTVKGTDDVTVKPGDGTTSGDDDDTPGNNTENGGSLIGSDLTLRVNQTAAIELAIPGGLSVEPKFEWSLNSGGSELVSMTVKDNTLSATFKGLKVGETGYTVSLVSANGNIEAAKGKITVIAERPISSLELDPAAITMAQNALPQTIKPIYTPEDSSMPEFSWTSSVPTVATVSQEGVVTPVSQGETVITATAKDGSGLSATSKVTVTAPIDDNFEFDESVMGGVEGVTIFIGESYTIVPKAHDGYQLPENIRWSSSDENIVSVDQNGKVTGIAVGSATISATATINGKEITASCTVNVIPVKVSSIEMTPTTAELKVTETLALKVKILPENATDPKVQWTTNAPAIASVSQEGVVTALMVGEANITARATDGSNMYASCLVKVIPTIATGIEITANGPTTLKATETVQLTAIVTPETTTDKRVSWKSENPDIATVNDSGVVTGVSVGEATISATNSAGQTARILITIEPTPVESIELNRYTLQIRVQDGFHLSATVLPATATNKSVEWSSSAPDVVSVDKEGNVLALALGEATITAAATDGSGVTAICRVTVTTTATQSVTISADGSTTLKAEETVQLRATVLPETASDKSVRWLSDNTDVAIVDRTGLVTAISVGSAQITATNSGGQSASVTVTVVPTPVETIELNRNTLSLKATETFPLIATVGPETATDKSLEWTTDNETVARVNQNGVVTALATGEAIITVTAKDGSGVSASCKVNVTATEVTSITISANGSTTLQASQNVQLIATILPETATDKSVVWTSGTPEVADVNENGLVTAYSVGESVITATSSSGLTAQLTITVIPTPVTSITLSRTSLTMRVSNERQLQATVSPETATDKSVTWSSANPTVATVDENGNVKALLEGQTSITCVANDGSGVSATCIVNVVDTDVETITITAEGPTRLKVSETVQLNAVIEPETSTDQSISWSSNNEAVATVDQSGLVTAVSEGVSVIKATTANGLSDEITITVIETQVSSITLNEKSIILLANETFNLIPDIQPITATNKQLIWSTGNRDIATVSQDGVVTAIAVGETTVTATATDGSGVTASCSVTVIPTPATSISISVLGETTLEINQTVQLLAEVLPENATDKTVVWSSSNKGVATVTETGLVTALSAGETVITATNSAGQYDRVTITVVGNGSDTPDIPDTPTVKADTPTQLLRKGDGTSHTFIAMMEKSDTALEGEGYRYVFGWDEPGDEPQVIANGPYRYAHTDAEIYWNENFDFWVFAYYVDNEGKTIVSSRRHLDGSVDEDFDADALIGMPTRSEAEFIIGIYTLEGQFIGLDIDSLEKGIYIVRTNNSSYKIIK